MIIGRYLIDSNTGQICDYMGLIYPFGFQGIEAIIYFDEAAIEKVVFEGYLDEEEVAFSQEVIKELNLKKYNDAEEN